MKKKLLALLLLLSFPAYAQTVYLNATSTGGGANGAVADAFSANLDIFFQGVP